MRPISGASVRNTLISSVGRPSQLLRRRRGGLFLPQAIPCRCGSIVEWLLPSGCECQNEIDPSPLETSNLCCDTASGVQKALPAPFRVFVERGTAADGEGPPGDEVPFHQERKGEGAGDRG